MSRLRVFKWLHSFAEHSQTENLRYKKVSFHFRFFCPQTEPTMADSLVIVLLSIYLFVFIFVFVWLLSCAIDNQYNWGIYKLFVFKKVFLYRFANLVSFAFVIDVIFLTKPAIIKSALHKYRLYLHICKLPLLQVLELNIAKHFFWFVKFYLFSVRTRFQISSLLLCH